VKLLGDFTPDAVGRLILLSHNNWKAIDQYVNLVLSTREEEERQRQRHPEEV